jgi:hypothetical protein
MAHRLLRGLRNEPRPSYPGIFRRFVNAVAKPYGKRDIDRDRFLFQKIKVHIYQNHSAALSVFTG